MPGKIRRGKGWFIVGGEYPDWDPLGFKLKVEHTDETWESGEVNSDLTVPTGTKWELEVTMKDAHSAEMWSMFLGTSVTTGQVLIARDEAQTVPATPFAVTLNNADNIALTERVRDAVTGYAYTRVAAGPAVGEYTIASEVLTFNATDEAQTLLITYMRTNATAGQKLTVGTTDLPSMVAFKGYLDTYDMDTGAMATQMQGVHLLRCKPTGDATFGYEANSLGEITWKFKVEHLSSGDVVFFFDDPTRHT